MAERTDHAETLRREEAADELERLASELRSEGVAEVPVGNKLLTLSPSATVEYSISIEERSPMFRSDHETVTVRLDWTVDRQSQDE